MSIRRILMAVFGLFLLSGGSVHASDFQRYSLSKLVETADLVAVVRVAEMGSFIGTDGRSYRSAIAQADTVLKGEPQGTIELVAESPFPESDPECCEIGATYVVFVKRNENGQWYGVNGRYSVVRVLAAAPSLVAQE